MKLFDDRVVVDQRHDDVAVCSRGLLADKHEVAVFYARLVHRCSPGLEQKIAVTRPSYAL